VAAPVSAAFATLARLAARLRPRRLHLQIAALGALLLAGVVGVSTWRTVGAQTEAGHDALEAHAEALGRQIAAASAALLITRRYSELEELLLRMAQFPDVERIRLVNRERRVVADIARRSDGTPQALFDTPAPQPPDDGRPVTRYRADQLVVWVPVEAGGRIGWVCVELSLEGLAAMRARILRDGLLTALVSIALSVALLVIALRSPMRAVERATEFASSLARARGQVQPVEHGSREVERLGQALNEVSVQLAEQDEALRSTSRRLQAVLQHAIDGIVTMSDAGRIESVNPAAERIFGYPADQLVGRPFADLVPDFLAGADGAQDIDPPPLSASGDVRLELEAMANRADGSRFPLMLGLSEMQLEDRRVYVGIVRDVSERKRLDQMKNDFIAAVSHELRTPLTSLHGSLSLLASGEIEGIGGKGRELVALAHKNSRRLVRLINDILDFESIESGRSAFDMQVLDARALLEPLLAAQGDYAGRRGVPLALECAPGTPAVLADPDMLTRALTHLLVNAIRLSPAGEAVRVTAALRDGQVRIAVADRGPGIPPEQRPYLFQKFVQVDAADIRYKEGAGLGLSLARMIVERLGGRIDFDSTPGEGTTFFVDLPAVE
jgi:PAS domain S-box-containing protein